MIDQKTIKNSKLKRSDSNSRVYILDGDPAFMSTTRDGIGKSCDPSRRNKLLDSITLTGQHDDADVLNGPLSLHVCFYFYLPQAPSSKRRSFSFGSFYTGKPDIIYGLKYIIEVSKGIIYNHTSFISKIDACKIYDERPRAEFIFAELK